MIKLQSLCATFNSVASVIVEDGELLNSEFLIVILSSKDNGINTLSPNMATAHPQVKSHL